MNSDQAIEELTELSDHLKTLVEQILAGEYDEHGELAYQGHLAHLMDHFARAWHFAHMTNDEVAALTSEQFESLTNAIPKLRIDQRMVEPWEKVV